MLDRTLSVAPMMDRTDRHHRYFMRLVAPRTLLYTEMVTTGALLHGDVARHLAYNPEEHPVALQLGGSEPAELAHCARLAEEWGYDEVNLNVGCPSDRVQNGRFGACLMAEPGLVAECVAAMREAVALPVTVKHRIGIDHQDDYAHLHAFVDRVAAAGCGTFIVHARKAWLQGLSPKENREKPPLRHEEVHRLKREFPELEIITNGGLRSVEDMAAQLPHLDGAMIGRAAYERPWIMAEAERRFLGEDPALLPRREVVERYMAYMERELDRGVRLQAMARHILGLFQGMPGARAWRRHISENAPRRDAGVEVIREALEKVAPGCREEAALAADG
ncbi:tRNA-dihydrouridine synthase A [Thiohalorhabdus denitrificans]|uniref:tRNA-dihydrouridine(20/20a) synthase n=1 Tax=Thiohalorhabdus denitrificans TaxID=381306 RepID=A0A0P9CEB3_9GAMM|nr:tRNA dihydrouridine(20/20a) synthase DusA [Thiohalorhabdus denitrificans]KPV41216.1 tRNA-dihydrouridine synthase A [Thiohalorhabdus denitrificans]SCY63708.1 tRNA-U16,U17-dihydrouridine synthase [Thiohalorhabdus denitrificans]